MSSATSRLSIPFVKSSEAIPTCKPNLMPFHIQYTGPADVSAFMRVEKLKDDETDTGISPVATGTSTPSTLPQVVAPLQRESSKMDVEDGATLAASTPEGSASQPADVDMAPPSLPRANTETSLGADSVLESSASTSTLSVAPSSSSLGISAVTSQTSLATSVSTSSLPQMQAPPIEDIERRVVSSFRGRTIHGLEIDIPKGYVGLVLKAENILPSSSDATKGKGSAETSEVGAPSSSRPRRNAASMDDEEELERPTRRRGRFTSSAAVKPGTVIELEDDPEVPQDKEMVDLTQEQDSSNASDPVDQDGSVPVRNLAIQAQFPSFTLWHSDRIVDKTNDEYFKALTEWLDLSSEIHQTDLTVEGC